MSGLPDARVLAVGGGQEQRGLLIQQLRQLGVVLVEQAADAAEALAWLDRAPFDLALLDIAAGASGEDDRPRGLDLLERLRRLGGAADRVPPVVVVSDVSDMDAVVRCVSLGAEDYLFKPVDPVLLHARVRASVEKKRLRDRTRDVLAARAAELAQARTLQQALLPSPLATATLTVDVLLQPAREIGGDFVDHFPIGPGLHAVLVGDVSDKGAAAALVMARAHALVHGLLIRPDAAELLADPARTLGIVNAALASRNEGSMFATVLLAVLDTASHRLRYCRAGHVPPWIRRAADGSIERLDALGGIPMGLFEDAEYESHEVGMAPGDLLLVVSDGVTEAEAPGDGNVQFGDAGVEACLRSYAGEDDAPLTLLALLLSRVRAHEAGRPAGDDLAALAVRFAATR